MKGELKRKDKWLKEGDVILHSDNSRPIKGAMMPATLQKLGSMPSFNRPSVSAENSYLGSLFERVKYCPQYPHKPFITFSEAKYWATSFVEWYNPIHQHRGINFVTLHSRHEEGDKLILEKRKVIYTERY